MRVLVYGYGWSGKSMLEFLEDCNARKERDVIFDVSVYDAQVSPFIRDTRYKRRLEDILSGEVDFIFVCIFNTEKAQKVALELEEYGIVKEKIKHINNYFYANDLQEHLASYANADFVKMWEADSFSNLTFNHLISDSANNREKEIAYSEFYFIDTMKNGLSDDLLNEEKKLMEYYVDKEVEFPILGVTYSLGRCGTTVMTQWLASLGISDYPMNYLKPYIYTPLNGFRHIMLLKRYFDIKNVEHIEFKSEFGVTKNLYDLLEFNGSRMDANSYNCSEVSLTMEQLEKVKALYAGICDITQNALSVKLMPQDIVILEKICNKGVYIVLDRDIYTHTLALLNLYRHREMPLIYYSAFADERISFDENPLLYTAITLKNARAYREKILSKIEERRKIRVTYEEFCRNPKALFDRIMVAFNEVGFNLKTPYKGAEQFTISPRTPDEESRKIIDSVFYSNQYDKVF